MKDNPADRRQSPRVERELALKVRTEQCDLVTQTKNISCNGAYCEVNRFIEPLTKLSIVLLLPLKTESANTNFKVQCKGVVVRAEQKPPHGFNIAIYFNDISKRDKEKISKFIDQFTS